MNKQYYLGPDICPKKTFHILVFVKRNSQLGSIFGAPPLGLVMNRTPVHTMDHVILLSPPPQRGANQKKNRNLLCISFNKDCSFKIKNLF